MALTPKVSDLKEINELLDTIKRLETAVASQNESVELLKDQYKAELTRQERTLSGRLINKKRLAAFADNIDELSQEESKIVDSLVRVRDNVRTFINNGGLQKYIAKVMGLCKDGQILAGEDVVKFAPVGSNIKPANEGQLRVKTSTKIYIFDPVALEEELVNRSIENLVTV